MLYGSDTMLKLVMMCLQIEKNKENIERKKENFVFCNLLKMIIMYGIYITLIKLTQLIQI